MKKIVFTLSLLLCILNVAAQNMLSVNTTNVDFENVLPGKTETRTVTIKNTTIYTLDCIVDSIQQNSLTEGAFKLTPSVNAEDGVYNLWPGESATLYFTYSPEVENAEENATFEVRVKGSNEGHKINLTGSCENTRTLRMLSGTNTYTDYNHVDSLTTADNNTAIIWSNGKETAIPISAVDSVLFMITKQHYIPTTSQRGYEDSGDGYEIQMRDNVIYMCQDVDKDFNSFEEETGDMYFYSSQTIDALGIQEGDILYSARRTTEFPSGYCYKVLSVTKSSNAKQRRAASMTNDDNIPDGMYCFKVEPISSTAAIDHIHETTVGAGNVAPFTLPEPASFKGEGLSWNMESDLSLDIGDILSAITGKKNTLDFEHEYDEEKREHTFTFDYKVGKDEKKHKIKLVIAYMDDKMEDFKTFSITFDRETVKYDGEENQLVYEYSIIDPEKAKKTGMKCALVIKAGFDWNNTFDFDAETNGEVTLKVVGDIESTLLASIEYKKDYVSNLLNIDELKADVFNDGDVEDELQLEMLQELKNFLKGNQRFELTSIPIPVPKAMQFIVNPKLGIWWNASFDAEGKLTVKTGLEKQKWDYNYDFVYDLKKPGIGSTIASFIPRNTKLAPRKPFNWVFNIEGSLKGELDTSLDVGLQMDLPHLWHGPDYNKRESYIGVYLSPGIKGSISSKSTVDFITGDADTEFILDYELYAKAKAEIDVGYEELIEYKNTLDYDFNLSDLGWTKGSYKWYKNFNERQIINVSPSDIGMIKCDERNQVHILFKWKDISEDPTLKYEVYLGDQKKMDHMKLIATINAESGRPIARSLAYAADLPVGEYFWYVKVIRKSGDVTWSRATSFFVIGSFDYVDLGLPSGTQWSVCNIGAEVSNEKGNYYAWGETSGYDEGKSSFSWSRYLYCHGESNSLTKYCSLPQYGYNNYIDTYTQLLPEDDIATSKYGGYYAIPTKADWDELIKECRWSRLNNGVLIRGKNNNVIFLPYAGYFSGNNLYDDRIGGYYWTSSLDVNSPDDAWYVYIGDGKGDSNRCYYRCQGRSVRPVFRQPKASAGNNSHNAPASPQMSQEPVERIFDDGLVVKTVSRSAVEK